MAKKVHPLEAAFDDSRKITLPGGGGAARGVEVHSIPVPWRASGGLCVHDLFAGSPPTEIPLPANVESLPPLRFSTWKHGALFLAQRWSDAPIVRWEEAGVVPIDRAALCVSRRGVGSRVDPVRLEDALQASASSGRPFVAEGEELIAIYVQDDGGPTLYKALDESGQIVGWVLNLAEVELPWEPDENLVPPSLQAFIKPQRRYAVAGRREPTGTFYEWAQKQKLPSTIRAGHDWSGAAIGDVEVKKIDVADHSYYGAELERVGLPQPASLFRIVFRYHYTKSAKDPHWRAMLAAMAELARDTRGILYQFEGDEPLTRDFGA